MRSAADFILDRTFSPIPRFIFGIFINILLFFPVALFAFNVEF